MRLRTEVLDLVGFRLGENERQVRAVGQVAVSEFKAGLVNMRFFITQVDPLHVDRRVPALDATHQLALFKQKFG
jgi:hypothetical protein